MVVKVHAGLFRYKYVCQGSRKEERLTWETKVRRQKKYKYVCQGSKKEEGLTGKQR